MDTDAPSVRAAKAALREEITARRGTLTPAQLESAGRRLAAAVLALPQVDAARCVACYGDIAPEPPTLPLLSALRDHGVRLLLPILCPDRDLRWGEYGSPHGLVEARWGLREPGGPDLGKQAIGQADVVVAPAVAVGRDGVRLGRGGGSYDRALARASADALVIALLHDGELLPAGAVPAEPHDRVIDAVATPSGGVIPLR